MQPGNCQEMREIRHPQVFNDLWIQPAAVAGCDGGNNRGGISAEVTVDHARQAIPDTRNGPVLGLRLDDDRRRARVAHRTKAQEPAMTLKIKAPRLHGPTRRCHARRHADTLQKRDIKSLGLATQRNAHTRRVRSWPKLGHKDLIQGHAQRAAGRTIQRDDPPLNNSLIGHVEPRGRDVMRPHLGQAKPQGDQRQAIAQNSPTAITPPAKRASHHRKQQCPPKRQLAGFNPQRKITRDANRKTDRGPTQKRTPLPP